MLQIAAHINHTYWGSRNPLKGHIFGSYQFRYQTLSQIGLLKGANIWFLLTNKPDTTFALQINIKVFID